MAMDWMQSRVAGLLAFVPATAAVSGCSEPARAAVVLTVHGDTRQDSVLVLARAGTEAWFEVSPRRVSSTVSEFDLHVEAAYSYAVRCYDELDRLIARQVNLVAEEEPDPHAYCRLMQTAPADAAVEGTLLQAGLVAAGNQSRSSETSNWSFRVPVASGLVDLVALSSDRISMARNLRVDRSRNVGLLDLTTDGVPLETIPVSLAEAPTFTTTDAVLTTEHGTSVLLASRGDLAVVVPTAGLLTEADRLEVSITTSEPEGRQRGIQQRYAGEALSLALLPLIPVSAITASQSGSVPLGDLPVVDGGSLALTLIDPQVGRSVVSSHSWLLAMNAASLGFDLPPLFDAYAAAGSVRRSVSVSVDGADGALSWTTISR